MSGGGGSKETTIGYKYFLGMHMVICHAPLNPRCDAITEILVGERSAWTGNVTSTGSIYVDAPDLFGGEKSEGGVAGVVDIMMGDRDQARNSYLTSVLGAVVPAFRNVVSVVLRQCYVTAMTPYPKAWAFKVRRIPAYDWYPQKANINGGANAAHIIYEVLTNTQWAMGYAPDIIDEPSFKSCADTLFAEGLGLSFSLTTTDSIESFIYTVVQHVNGMFYTRPDNGKFALKLLRNNYDVLKLPTYDENNIISLESFERPSYAEIVNEIVVVYRPQGTKADDSVTVQDLAGIAAQEGVISQTVNYPGIDNADNAARVGMRDLRQKSTPLARVKITVLRSAWDTAIGDCISFTWLEHGIKSMVLRVLGVNLGTLASGGITIDAVEDVFGLPNATYVGDQPSGWVDPIVAPSSAVYVKAMEAPYWDVARQLSQSNFSFLTPTSAFVGLIVGQPATVALSYDLWTCLDGKNYTYKNAGEFAAHCLCTTDVTILQTAITVSSFKGNMGKVALGSYAIFGDEIVSIVAFSIVNNTVVIGRGCLDTVPKPHPPGTRLYFSQATIEYDATEYITGENINLKALTRTSKGVLGITEATPNSIQLVGRFYRPYPPGNFKINGLAYPAEVLGGFEISWAHRDRTMQLAGLVDTTTGSIGPETGTTYNVVITTVPNVVSLNITGITGNSYTPNMPSGIYSVRVQLTSVRNGVSAFQFHDHTCNLEMFEGYITTQSGDIFCTEDNAFTFILE